MQKEEKEKYANVFSGECMFVWLHPRTKDGMDGTSLPLPCTQIITGAQSIFPLPWSWSRAWALDYLLLNFHWFT